MMKIAHVSATFPPYWAGTGNVAYHNARVLHERGHDITVFTARTPRDGEMSFPFEVRPLAAPVRIGNAPLTPALIGELEGFDLIHLHYPYIFGAELVLIAAARFRTPLVITYHNDLIAGGLRGRLFRLYSALNQRLVLRRADRLIATSRDYALHSRFAGTAPEPEAVEVVPNGVDITLFRPSDQPGDWRGEFGIPEDAPVALFVGGMDRAHYFKGVDVLLEAFARTPTEAHLVLVGAGEMEGDYQRRAAELSPGRTHFAGKVPLDRLVALYQGSTVTVLPSTTQGEAFGMVLAEAMACGTPAIASDLPGVRTVVENGVTGYLTRPGDPEDLARALNGVLEDPARGQQMGCAGYQRVLRKYSWDVVVDELERIYLDVLRA